MTAMRGEGGGGGGDGVLLFTEQLELLKRFRYSK
jgi:hypothetical protein